VGNGARNANACGAIRCVRNSTHKCSTAVLRSCQDEHRFSFKVEVFPF
jgi:hypothetical protein